ncbi:ClbS/DfsB family four-helix bundle protein [Rhodococcus sp. PSBB049]|uniref:ClbS/DfsB family four-helix bundle protein n=1 Tax=Rhodococcus sp. PSBB049 TaxID=2812863 RepID=UPI0019801B9A|nr:ClbS/DfsB family four-helix bundle protein [Rhodococcus sp. PSBB049]QSE72367.1 ClbS/DfsB family four-helix bundle protein [Rhodococcus sp. PSBB049]
MAVPQTKNELLQAVTDSYDALARELQRVPTERAREVSLPGHRTGTWMSPADLVAYLIGWNELVLSWHEHRARGIEPQVPAPGYTWGQLGQLAQKFYREKADVPWPDLLQRLAAANSRIVALIRELDDDELYGAPWYRTYTAGRMIQLNTSSPYTNARRRLRTWLRATAL